MGETQALKAIVKAAELGDVDAMKSMIGDTDAEVTWMLNFILLSCADAIRLAYEANETESTINRRIQRMKTTLEAGADPNAKDPKGMTALHIIAGAPFDVDGMAKQFNCIQVKFIH